MRAIFLGFTLLSLFLAGTAKADLCDFPKNDLFYSQSAGTGISLAEYEDALNQVEKVYAPVFRQKHNARLLIKRSWNNGSVNAQAYQDGQTWIIEMFGGLARTPKMTKKSYMQVACHEIGHHIGGMPRYGHSGMSVEGQSDRFSAKCMQALGINSDVHGDNLAVILGRLSGEAKVPSPDTPAKYCQKQDGHPAAQCRMDEMRASRRGLARRCCWYGR